MQSFAAFSAERTEPVDVQDATARALVARHAGELDQDSDDGAFVLAALREVLRGIPFDMALGRALGDRDDWAAVVTKYPRLVKALAIAENCSMADVVEEAHATRNAQRLRYAIWRTDAAERRSFRQRVVAGADDGGGVTLDMLFGQR